MRSSQQYKRIFRETVPADDLSYTFMLTGPVLHVATRALTGLEFWHLVDPYVERRARTFKIVGTGHPIDPEFTTYIGTAVTPSGAFVWHLMESRSEEDLRVTPC